MTKTKWLQIGKALETAAKYDKEAFEQALFQVWRTAGCDMDGAPYVIRNMPLQPNDPPQWQRRLAGIFLGSEKCDATGTLTARDKVYLTRIRDIAP